MTVTLAATRCMVVVFTVSFVRVRMGVCSVRRVAQNRHSHNRTHIPLRYTRDYTRYVSHYTSGINVVCARVCVCV